nr:CheR family methyltransferase [Pseudobdellovibrionaceae bacterium]
MEFETAEVIKSVVQKVSKVVSEMAGIQLGERQHSMVENRLKTRLMRLGIPTFQEYFKYLEKNKESESQALMSLMTTHHTYFFREFSHFEYLLNSGLPQAIERARNRRDKTIHVWSAACSRGQEVYSLAMFFTFHLSKMAP